MPSQQEQRTAVLEVSGVWPAAGRARRPAHPVSQNAAVTYDPARWT
jgi:hypothetical protein